MTPDEFRRWAGSFPEALMLVTNEGLIIACNRPLLTLMELPASEVVGKPLCDFAPEASAGEVKAALRLWSGSGQLVYGLVSFVTRNGEPLRCEGGAARSLTGESSRHLIVRLKRHEAAVARFVGLNKKIDDLSSEIRARRQSEELVRQQREWFHVTLSSIGDAVIATDVQGCVEFMNGAAETLTGWSLAESRGRRMTDIFKILHEHTRDPAEDPVQHVLRDGQVVALANHTVLIAKDGSERPIEDSAAPIRASDGTLIGVVLVFHDVSERKTAEAALKASERRFRLWTELNVIATGVSDLVGMFLEANDALLDMLGYTRSDVAEGRVSWRDLSPPEHLEKDYRAIEEARLRGACRPYEKEYFHKDGRRVPVIIGYALFHEPGRYPRQQTDDLAICFILDISERKRTEELLEKRVAERTASLQTALAELEAFSYTISHDLRAPLRSMRSYAQLLIEDYGASLDAQAQDYLNKIMKSGGHLDQLIQDVLAYSRVSKAEVAMVDIDLSVLLGDLLERYPHFSAAGADIVIAPGLPTVRGNEALLAQCFSNLIGNAIKFVPPGRVPHVKIHAEKRLRRVMIWIEDNGIGIAAEDRERIFGIFERLHPSYEGTGIGLSIVRRALEKMGGSIGVDSEPGIGSRFWINLHAA